MDPKRIVMLVVGASVMVLIFSAILVPIVNDATTTEKTLTNEGYYRMSELGENDTTVITWSPATAATKSTIAINGEDYDLASTTPAYQSRSLAFAENLILRFFNEGNGNYSMQVWDAAFKIGGGSATVTDTVTVTMGNGTLSWNRSETGTTTEYAYTGNMIAIDLNGDMILKKSTDPAYLLPDSSIIYGGGISLLSGTTYSGVYLSGTVEDIDDSSIEVLNSNAAVSNTNVVYSPVSGYIDLVSFDKITFDTTYSNTTTTQTYSYVVVPYEVTAELAVHPDGATLSMLSVIPIIVMIGIILAVVGVAIVGRNDY